MDLDEVYAHHEISKASMRYSDLSHTYFVETSLKFLQWQALYELEKPFQIFTNIPDHVQDRRTTNLVFKDHNVKMLDVRDRSRDFTLDKNGFVYRNHQITPGDFTDRALVEKTYLPEIERLLRQEVDGVDEVFFFDWRVCSALTFCLCYSPADLFQSSGRMHPKSKEP